MAKKWTRENVIQKVQDTMEELEIEHLPSCLELRERGLGTNALANAGGLREISKILGVPIKPKESPSPGKRPKKYKSREIEPWRGKASKAAQIEAKARRKGLRYADIQKAETIEKFARVNV